MEQFIGSKCGWENYIGEKRMGTIVAMENYPNPFDPTIPIFLCYVTDDLNDDNNDKIDIVNGVQVRYADIRQSTEISLLDS